VENEIAAYALPAAAETPAVWPEVGGRGLMLAEPGRRTMGNANTLRFMAPHFPPDRSGRYMRYTDETGDYVDPRTGLTRSKQSTEDADGDTPLSEERRAQAVTPWSWPADEIQPVDTDQAARVALGRPVVDLLVDVVGARLVLDRGDGPEPGIYADLGRPEYREAEHWRLLTQSDSDAVVGASVVALVIAAGVVEITLSNGGTLRCGVDPRFEAWQLVAQGVGLWVCIPGGAVAAFLFARERYRR
jgi:hypothetical protein